MANWFEPAALFIMFREALEAAVIIAVLLQLMNKLNMRHLKRYVWIGALGGLVISIIIGVVFIIVFYVANTKIFSGNGELIFKGVIQWIASLMITVVAFAMLKFYNLERKWRYKLEKGVSAEALTSTRSQKWTIILLAGSATLREGIESVLFLTGVSAGEGIRAIWIPGLVGIALGLLAGVLLFYSGKPIKSLRWFFILSCCLLLLISSGLVVSGLGNFQAAGLFGPLYPYEARPWANRITWDTSACCSQTDNKFWAIINALFGYQDQPTNLMLLYYCLYWAIVLTLLFYKWWRGTLTDRREAELPSFRQHSDARVAGPVGVAFTFSHCFRLQIHIRAGLLFLGEAGPWDTSGRPGPMEGSRPSRDAVHAASARWGCWLWLKTRQFPAAPRAPRKAPCYSKGASVAG